MMKIYKNKPLNWACCIIISISLIFSNIAPAAAFVLGNQIQDVYGVELSESELMVESAEEVEIQEPLEAVPGFSRSQRAKDDKEDFSEQLLPYSENLPTINLFSTEIQYSLDLLDSHDYFSELSTADVAILCIALEVNNSAMEELELAGLGLAESIIYAKLEYAYGFSVTDILDKYPVPEDCELLRLELRSYTYFCSWQDEGFDQNGILKQYIFNGNTFQQVKQAYILNKILDINIGNLLSNEYVSSISTASLTVPEKKNFKDYAEEIQLNNECLMEFALENGLTCAELQDLVKTPVSQGAVRQMGSAPPTRAGFPSLLPGESETVPLNPIVAPYAVNDADNVNMSTGEVTYQNIDVVIPGRNGLDLVIGHRYKSSEANLFNPKITSSIHGVNVLNGQPFQDVYVVAWDTYYYIPSSGGYQIVDMDQGPYAKVFLASEYDDYLDFRDEIIYAKNHPTTFPNFNGTGQTAYFHIGVINYEFFPLEYWINNGKLQYFLNIYESGQTENTHLNDLYALGNGWGFMFSSIETVDTRTQSKVLHLSDGRSFTVNITPTLGDSNLKNYTLSDLRLEQEAGGYNGATWTLYYKDGKKEHFDSQGKLIAIRDRYNNTISFAHTTQNGLPKITITDTLNRDTTIYGTSVSGGGHIMTVALPDGTSLKFTVDKLNEIFGYDPYPYKPNGNIALPRFQLNKGYVLAQYQNQLNTVTSYKYSLALSRYNVIGKDPDFGVTYFFDYDDDGNVFSTANDTYVPFLKSINHPTGYRTDYTYQSSIHNLGASGVHTSYRPEYRNQILNNAIVNRAYYSWGADDYTGYTNGYNPDSLPSYYTYFNRYRLADGASLYYPVRQEYFLYNNKHLLIKWHDLYDEGYHNVKKFVYNPDKLLVEMVTKTYNPFELGYDPVDESGVEPPCHTAIELYEYDNNTAVTADKKGNVTASWSPLAGGNKAKTDYQTTYTYDPSYSLLLTKTYKQDANTTIKEQNTVSGLNIIRSEVLVNNVAQNKTEFVYGNVSYPGNITAERKYKDGLSTYIQTDYDYQSNAYLSEIKNTGILDSEGNLAVGTPLQPAGTILKKMAYNNMGRLTQSTDANNQLTSFVYNNAGDLTKQTNPDSTTVTYNRDYTANTLTVKDENNTYTRYDYTPFGQEYEVRHLGNSSSGNGTVLSRKIYDNLLRLQSEEDPLNGATTTYLYDSVFRLASKTTRNDSGTTLAQEIYDYNEAYPIVFDDGLPEIIIIIQGLYYKYFQRIKKTVVGEANAPATITTQYFDDMGRVFQSGRMFDNIEYIDYYKHDYVGNKIQERLTNTNNAHMYYYYNKWEYDYAGRVTKTYNADDGYMTNTYNALGQLAFATDFAGTASTFAYDGIGRLLEEKTPIEEIGQTVYNSIKRNDYDPAGNITSAYVSNNQVGQAETWSQTDYSYNSRGRLEYVTQYDDANTDNVTEYAYDGVGNTLTMSLGKTGKAANDGQETNYTYDRLGRILTLTDPLNRQETYIYKNNGLGLLDTKTDRNGNITDLAQKKF